MLTFDKLTFRNDAFQLAMQGPPGPVGLTGMTGHQVCWHSMVVIFLFLKFYMIAGRYWP